MCRPARVSAIGEEWARAMGGAESEDADERVRRWEREKGERLRGRLGNAESLLSEGDDGAVGSSATGLTVGVVGSVARRGLGGLGGSMVRASGLVGVVGVVGGTGSGSDAWGVIATVLAGSRLAADGGCGYEDGGVALWLIACSQVPRQKHTGRGGAAGEALLWSGMPDDRQEGAFLSCRPWGRPE
jgi:hypothetical protein